MEANIVCINCKHYKPKNVTCDAFKDGIPDEIISGENIHSEPLPEQDNEIVFEEGEPQLYVKN